MPLQSRRVVMQPSLGRNELSPRHVVVLFCSIRCNGLRMEKARRSRLSTRRPIERFAADIFERRTKKAVKKAKKLRELDARQRHKLRIAVKKLRYAGDFFGRLFSGHKTKKRLSAYEGSLKKLQDQLGALNDIQVHQKMVPKLALGKPRTNRR